MSQKRFSNKKANIQKFEAYTSLKDQLEAENEALMRERDRLQRGLEVAPDLQSFNTIVEHSEDATEGHNSSINHHSPKKGKKNKQNVIRQKIHEIIGMCSQQMNYPTGKSLESYQEVIEAEQQVLNYLDNLNQKNESRPRSAAVTGKPLRNERSREDSHFEVEFNKRKSGIREAIRKGGFQNLISDNAMQMIEQIERKTLCEIQKLRNDKIGLMKSLNTEVRDHNEEKRKRMILEKENSHLKQLLERNGLKGGMFSKGYQQYQNNYSLKEVEEEEEDSERVNQSIRSPPKSRNHISHNSNLPSNHGPRRHPNENAYQQQTPSSIHPEQNPKIPQSKPFQDTRFDTFHPTNDQLKSQLSQLEYENRKIKESMVYSTNNQTNENFKQKLRSELLALKHKIKNYEQILTSEQNSKGEYSTNLQRTNNAEMEYLLSQGNSIAETGVKLLRVKSNPELISASMRNNSGLSHSKKEELSREVQFLKNRINSLRRENEQMIAQQRSQQNQASSLSRQNSLKKPLFEDTPIRFYSPTPTIKSNSNFEPTRYQHLINEMKNAVRK